MWADVIIILRNCGNIKILRQYLKFSKELAPELSDEGIKLFYSLIVNVIIFHDYGKINPRFQSITMKNTLRKWTVIDCLEGTNHSMLSAAIYLDYFYEKIQESPLSKDEKYNPCFYVGKCLRDNKTPWESVGI